MAKNNITSSKLVNTGVPRTRTTALANWQGSPEAIRAPARITGNDAPGWSRLSAEVGFEMFAENAHNPGRRLAVPKRRSFERPYGFLENRSRRPQNAFPIHSDDLVRSVLHGRRPLRILAQGKARHADGGSLLLYPAVI